MNSVFQVTASRAIPVLSLAPGAKPPRSSIDSHALLKGQRELIIRHGDHEYRLRHTQNDKLILTK